MFLRPFVLADASSVLTTANTPGMERSLGQAFSHRTCSKWHAFRMSEQRQNLVVGFAMLFCTDPGVLEVQVLLRLLADDRRRLGKPGSGMCSCFFLSLTTLG